MSKTSIQAELTQAIQLHRQGRLQQASALYQRVLQQAPQNAQALHLFGILAAQTRQFERAVERILKAIAVDDKNPDFFVSLGNAYKEQGNLDQALQSYQSAIYLNPAYAQAHSSLGVVLQLQNKMDEALANFDQAIALQPNNVEALSNRAAALHVLGQYEQALGSAEKAIGLLPNFAPAHFNRANVLLSMGRFAQGVESCNRVLELAPQHVAAHFSKAFALMELQQPHAALTAYEQVTALDPSHVAAWTNRAVALIALKRWEDALTSCEKALAIDPNHAQAHNTRGVALHQLQRLDEALAAYDQVIALIPDHAEAHTNRGVVEHALCHLEKAIACYDTAIALAPESADAYFYKSLALLLRGKFKTGWPLYQWFWKTKKGVPTQRTYPQSQWMGEVALQGKTILLHSDQGLGDMIQFARYCKLLADQGAKVVLEAPAALFTLFKQLDGVHTLVEKGQELPAFDLHSPLLSLPFVLQTDLHSIPTSPAYLQAEDEKVRVWKEKLGPQTHPRIGLAWSGNTDYAIDSKRSITLSALLPYLPAQYELISLQKVLRDVDLPTIAAQTNLRHFGDELHDFSDTAALCSLMDVVISVDTSVAHLSGALGKPTWIMLPHVPDWRWLLDRNDSPWYASVRLYRQGEDAQWGPVFERIQTDLAQQ
jgi:tetratricopeptide (TPR) repeat protein